VPEPSLVDRVRAARRELMEHGPREERGAGDFHVVSVPARDGDVVRDVLLAEHARVVLEIGLAYGSSALAIGEALATRVDAGETVRHVIIDAFQEQFFDAGWRALRDAGLADVCELLRERSQLALPKLVTDSFTADAAFVDGSHVFHNVFVDLVFVHELVRPGGLVVLDDCQWRSVATAAQYFEANLAWVREPLPADSRLRAYRLPTPRPDPSFEHFKPFVA
jgi:predicted O-methyltransferase YrrM